MITTIKSQKEVRAFALKNLSEAPNVTYSVPVLLMVLLAAATNGHSIYSKAQAPDADTIFYRIDTTIRKLENDFWKQGLDFLVTNRKRLDKKKCYIVVDETYDSYTGKLLRKEKKAKHKLTEKEKEALKYLHKYKPKKGDTGSYKYLVFAVVYGKQRHVLLVKALKRKEHYKNFIIKMLLELRCELKYCCAIFDRGFYDGDFVQNLKTNRIPFIVRARISKTMKTIYGFYSRWKRYTDFVVGKSVGTCDLILGTEMRQGKRMKWAFVTNLQVKHLSEIRAIYKKRWNIENIFKATDGIQLRPQTSNPTTRMFCVCLSFLFYNEWQEKKNITPTTLLDFMVDKIEKLFNTILQKMKKAIEFYRDRLKIKIPFWTRIISSI